MIKLDGQPEQTTAPDLSPLYQLVDASAEDHFIFSTGATAVNHVAFSTYLDVTRKTGKHHYLCSNTDEAPAILSMTRLQELGCHFQMVEGTDFQSFAETVTPRTALISLSWANGLTGVIHPIKEIAALCKEREIYFHVDATHVLGKGDFSFQESGADFLTFNGGLFIRSGRELSPFIMGEEEPKGLKELCQAAQHLYDESDTFCLEKAHLRNLLEEKICAALPDAVVFCKEQPRLPSITAIGFPDVASDALFFLLKQRKVFTSQGGGNLQQMSHMLKALSIPSPLCYSGLSFTLSSTTTVEQIEIAADQVIDVVRRLRRYTP
ncbi:MAG: Cysteine desulfurase IscS [Chlamydiales bacterium]|nr:Cysteine desulfurase IscS [Chlamydiales bacterium]MCH9619427.1 Cysteine desulfurase IscS [Chlamydiales bacterium]MCH9622231.1 Cysteine desulfurase IscS [Chlamydiales bacterium]